MLRSVCDLTHVAGPKGFPPALGRRQAMSEAAGGAAGHDKSNNIGGSGTKIEEACDMGEGRIRDDPRQEAGGLKRRRWEVPARNVRQVWFTRHG